MTFSISNLFVFISFLSESPEEVPCSENWLTQCHCWIIPHEMHISPYLQEVFLCHALLGEMPILGEVLSEVATIQYL